MAIVKTSQKNISQENTSRSLGSILKENILTLFNMMLAVVALMVISTGSYKDCLFIFIIIINALIGITTELRAKRELDRLAILTEDAYKVYFISRFEPDRKLQLELQLKSSTPILKRTADLIVGDIVELSAGQQIPADGEIIEGHVEVNESMLTGESRNVVKEVGASLMSGTVVAVGHCFFDVQAAGADAYVSKLTGQAKVFKLAPSDLRDGINKILKYISFGIVPVALLLIITQMNAQGGVIHALTHNEWQPAILQAAAGIIGMIPEGLVLLTSLNLALASIILARKKVLVTELNSVETLARIDELILDKTGTITDGTVEVEEISFLRNTDVGDGVARQSPEVQEAYAALGAIAALPGGTSTSDAIAQYLEAITEDCLSLSIEDFATFDSAKKYSWVRINGVVYKLGAPEILSSSPLNKVVTLTSQGKRVLIMTADDEPTLLIVCRERIRKNAAEIFKYFINSGVHIQVVSGDNEETVRSIAEIVGIKDVVGRAKPETKLEIVHELQAEGKVVAMTGDGVNDMLALKDADLGIVMGNAAPASKSVANLVLIDSDFAMLPSVVGQGRRVIANIERVASLFLVKTFYSIGLTFTTIILQTSYPFMPRHLTLVSALTIGIPAFFLALPSNDTPYRKGFLRRVLRFSLPMGIAVTFLVTLAQHVFPEYCPTIQVVTLLVVAFLVVILKSRPLLSWRLVMIVILILLAVAAFFIPSASGFFALYR